MITANSKTVDQVLTRSIFRTLNGYLGIGTHHLQSGDLVVIFDGDRTPFIMREDRDPSGTSTGMYNLVGDCYLHGWMDGNFFGHTVIDEDGNMINGPRLNSSSKQTEKILRQQQFVIY